MVFCVSAAPLFLSDRISPDGVRRIFGELAEIGIGGIKIDDQTPGVGLDWPQYATLVAEAARECGLRISAHAPASDISAADSSTRNDAVATVRDTIVRFGSCIPGIVIAVHPEDYAPVRSPGDDGARIENCRNSMESLAEAASAHGVRIALENMRRRPNAPSRTGMLVDQLSEIIAGTDPSTVGICFDTGHANISEGPSVAEAFQRNAGRIIHIHYDDNLGADDSHLAPGDGNIDFDALFRAATNSEYDGMVELEVKVSEGDDPYTFFKRSHEYFLRAIRRNS